MTSQEDVGRFISSSFRSVWSLELLLLLKLDRRPWPREEMVRSLRASELVVTQALDSLVAAGLASIDADGSAIYMPVAADVEQLVDRTEEMYLKRPDAVRRLIISSSASGLTAFADAFRLWKG